MRADRLLSMLMLLQARGRMTAQKLAEELEVSVRTIYRDIDALSIAGAPVYAERGPGGGVSLLDGYRTSLTGMNESELQALFTLNVPASLADLGMMGDLRSALLKLSASLPTMQQENELWIRQRIHLDWSRQQQTEAPIPHLHTVRQAVWEDRKIRLSYMQQLGPMREQVERIVEPYGLVARAGAWFLVYAGDGRMRVQQVSELLDVTLLDEGFIRSEAFDLPGFWADWCAELDDRQQRYPVTVRVGPALLPYFPQHFGDAIRTTHPKPNESNRTGWTTISLTFDSLESARIRLLGFGRAIEVMEPEALRQSVADFAQQTVNLYTEGQH